MNSHQINCFLRHHPYFRGTFPVNKLPPVSQYPSCYVVNNQTENLPGQHWIAIWVDEKRVGEVFDSFGMLPPTWIQLWMNRNCRYWTYNQKLYQNPLTNLCGAYCIYYLVHRIFVVRMDGILHGLNDTLVRSFIKNYKH